jgi:hypothetical protein
MNYFNSTQNTANYSQIGRSSAIFLVVALIIIGFIVIYYYKRKYNEPKYIFKTDQYSTTNVNAEYTDMLTPTEIGTYIKNNFTLSFFIYVDPISGSPTNNIRLITFGGFGEMVLDRITNKLILKVNTTVSLETIEIPDFTPANWIQITIISEGATIKIYRNGIFVTSKVLSNLPMTKPQIVQFVKQVNNPFKVSYVHAYGYVLSGSEVMADYRSMLPEGSTVPYVSSYYPTLSMNDLTQTFKRIMETIGIKPVSEDDLRLGPTNYINYEYA